jgi:hypothetical protein
MWVLVAPSINAALAEFGEFGPPIAETRVVPASVPSLHHRPKRSPGTFALNTTRATPPGEFGQTPMLGAVLWLLNVGFVARSTTRTVCGQSDCPAAVHEGITKPANIHRQVCRMCSPPEPSLRPQSPRSLRV